jgi:hypothetical protein
VHADVPEVVAEARLHVTTQRLGQRFATGAGRSTRHWRDA